MTFTIGGQPIKVKLLHMAEAAAWREEFSKAFGGIALMGEVTSENPTEYNSAIHTILVTMPGKVIDLFFLYAKDLKREEVEKVAYDYEIAEAFKVISKVSFTPLAGSLVQTIEGLSQ